MADDVSIDVTERESRRLTGLLQDIPAWVYTIAIPIIYGLLAIMMTWPLVTQLGSHWPGGDGDALVHRWTYWWVRQALIEGQNPFFTNLLFHPEGVSLTAHGGMAWFNILFWNLLQPLVGDIAAFDLIYLVAFTLNGFALYLLAYEWIGSRPASFISGLIFAFWPYIISRFGHARLILLAWIPLSLLFLRRTMDEGRVRDALLAGLFLALTGLTNWQLLVMGSVIVGLYLLYRVITDATCRTKRTLGLLALVGLAALIIMTPFLTPIVIDQLNRGFPEDLLIGDPSRDVIDLLAFVLPNTELTFWGSLAQLLPENMRFESWNSAFIGFTVLVLAFFGTWKKWPATRFWLLAGLAYIILALGSQLKVGAQLFPQVPMPYRLIEDFFVVQILRFPSRFGAATGIPLAMLAGFGVAALLQWRPLANRSLLVVSILALLILAEYARIPFRTGRVETPAWYQQLAEEPDQFAILDLPMHPVTFDKRYMLFQMTHGKGLVEGHVSRLTQDDFRFLDSTPFLNRLRVENVMDPLLFDVSHQLQPLAEADIRYLILHKDRVPELDVAIWRNWLAFEPAHEDDELVVYRTDPQLGRDFVLAHELNDEIGLINFNFGPETLNPGGFLQVDVSWGSKDVPGMDYDICLQLVDEAGSLSQSQCGALAPSWPTSRWEADEVVRDHYIMHLEPTLALGTYTIHLALSDPAAGALVGEPALLGEIVVEGDPISSAESIEPDQQIDARWRDLFSLTGYDLQILPDEVALNLYWQALSPTTISYKVFVHVINQDTGELVAQSDAIPRNWTYPTNLWQPGELIQDPIKLSLEDVPAGDYRLQVGLYDPDDGQRLEVFADDGSQYPGDSVPLADFRR